MKQNKEILEKTLPTIRISKRDISNMNEAIKKFNKNNLLKMNEAGFRRIAYKVFAQMILTDEKIPFSFQEE